MRRQSSLFETALGLSAQEEMVLVSFSPLPTISFMKMAIVGEYKRGRIKALTQFLITRKKINLGKKGPSFKRDIHGRIEHLNLEAFFST